MRNTHSRPRPSFRTFPCANFADTGRPGHILALGDRLTHKVAHHAFEAAGDTFSTFRMAVYNVAPITSVAIEVEVTGRYAQFLSGDPYIKATITFVGDGEPSYKAKGWVRL